MLSRVRLFATPCTVQSMEFSRQNTGVGSLSLLQGIFPTQGLNLGLPYCRQILYQLSHREAQEYWSGEPILSPVDLPDPGIERGSPSLQADSLPTELSAKPFTFKLKVSKTKLLIFFIKSILLPFTSHLIVTLLF